DQTWTRANAPYELHSNVRIEAGVQVTVEPGVTIISQGDWRLTVAGSLTVQSNGGTRTVFRAPDMDAVGAWKGLYFLQGSRGCFEHCSIRSGDYGILADSAALQLYDCRVRQSSLDGVYVWGATRLRARDSNFKDNGRYGLHIQTSKPWGWIRDSIFDGNGDYACVVKATCVEMLGSGNTFKSNGKQLIGVDCGSSPDIEDDDIWVDQGVPYDLNAGGRGQELEIAAGARLKIRSGARIYPPDRIVVAGELLVSGTGRERVTISPAGTPQPGDWLGLDFNAGSYGRLANVTIRYAREGVNVDDATVELIHARIRDSELDGLFAGGASNVQVTDSIFRDCGRSGLRLPQAATGGGVTGCRFIGCGDYPVYLTATRAEIVGAGNIYRRNARQRIGVSCDLNPDIEDDDIWSPQSVPFDLTANAGGSYLRVATTGRLQLDPGVQVMGGGIGATGVLVIEGADANPVILGSAAAAPSPGDWLGVEFLPGGAGSIVHATLTWAQIGVSVASSGDIRISDTDISNCSSDGIRLSAGAAPVIRCCSIHDNGEMGVRIKDNAQPLLGIHGSGDNPGRNSLYDNALYDLYNNTPLAQRAEDNWWKQTTTAGIAARIYDHDDNAALGSVDFRPYLDTRPAAAGGEVRPGAGTLAVMHVAAVPTGAGAAIHITLSRPADARITIRNIAGRPVRELAAGIGLSEVVTWDRRGACGTPVPAGIYLIEVEAHGDDGETARGLATLKLK
ncbi:MAG: right-handed parallel beta-helix repeat-containing protein, partial [Armatimonadetes bacterium]|nr:right-handed parallel beta-helix repeat-containing protein [Armatimonadota bacterium]